MGGKYKSVSSVQQAPLLIGWSLFKATYTTTEKKTGLVRECGKNAGAAGACLDFQISCLKPYINCVCLFSRVGLSGTL